MPVQSAGNSLYFGDPFMSLKDYGLGILGGALTGGIGNGMVAERTVVGKMSLPLYVFVVILILIE